MTSLTKEEPSFGQRTVGTLEGFDRSLSFCTVTVNGDEKFTAVSVEIAESSELADEFFTDALQ
ncbi:MAG TPA: hypothetical protein H9881_10910 [Candidatus Stackebrandtia excrementipullorum]|nr:hypothetical protein [Candidatus Stackebrandtia excrementipullorum]